MTHKAMKHWLDQYGTAHHAASTAALCAQLGYAKGSYRSMYRDTKDGTVKVGVVVGHYWLSRFEWVHKSA